MALCFNKRDIIGYVEVNVEYSSEPIRVDIYGGNALAVFVCSHDSVDDLFWFFADRQHIANMWKMDRNVFPFDVEFCRINYSHPSAPSLVKAFTRQGITVECY